MGEREEPVLLTHAHVAWEAGAIAYVRVTNPDRLFNKDTKRIVHDEWRTQGDSAYWRFSNESQRVESQRPLKYNRCVFCMSVVEKGEAPGHKCASATIAFVATRLAKRLHEDMLLDERIRTLLAMVKAARENGLPPNMWAEIITVACKQDGLFGKHRSLGTSNRARQRIQVLG